MADAMLQVELLPSECQQRRLWLGWIKSIKEAGKLEDRYGKLMGKRAHKLSAGADWYLTAEVPHQISIRCLKQHKKKGNFSPVSLYCSAQMTHTKH